ncbi:MAG: hypothetical protein HC831_15640 [Chloroflexia bacterium]|nr:hypothetical protein [Chloroflexia bacterium]
MNDFPEYPTDFVAMTRSFEDEEIEKLISQSHEDVVRTIDMLKKREVNATQGLSELRFNIEKKIWDLEEGLKSEKWEGSSIKYIIQEQIKTLIDLL